MLGTKLLLILVPLLLVEGQNRRYGTVNRLPFRRPVVRPRTTTTTLPPPTVTTDESPSYLPEKDNYYVADTSNVLLSPKIVPEDSKSTEPLTIVYPENYNPLPSSSRPTYLPNRRPNLWHRPINALPTSSVQNQLIPRFPSYMSTKPAETTEEATFETLPTSAPPPPTTQPPPPTTTQPPPPPTTQPPPPPTTQPPPPPTTQPPPPPTTQPPPPPSTQPPPPPPTTQSPKPVHIWQPEIEDSLYPNIDYVESSAADEPGIAVQPDYPESSYPAWQPQKRPIYTPPAITESHIQSRPTTSKPITRPSRPITSKPITIPSRPATSKPITRPSRPITSKPITIPSRPATSKPITKPVTPQMQWQQTTRKPLSYDINQLQDYVCQETNGYEPVANQCDVYIACRRNLAYQNVCPDGLYFNRAVRYPEYPCGYPSEVQCESADEIRELQPSGQCPHRYGFYALSSSDCSQYMRCQEGLPTIMSCPAGLAFNSASSSCDWPANVPGCNLEVFQGFTCPATEAYNESRIVSKYRFKNSCTKYIACYRGYPRLLSCDRGMFFDPVSSSCIDDDQVHDCQD